MTEGRFALIIASYQFEDEGLSQLIAPAQDAEALARVLADPKIGDFKIKSLLNEHSHKVRQEIETFFADRKRDDMLMLYFSGHGIKSAEGQLFFATADTKRNLLRSTAVSANFVNEMMCHSRSRQQVLLLDCCYSGAFARGMVVRADKTVGTGEFFKGGRGQVVLTASDAMQYAFEGDEIKGEGVRSIFTHTLVRGLETGEADVDKDGGVSFEDMYGYLYDRVTEQRPEQQPRKWAFDVQGDIIIARNPKPIAKPLPYELQQAIENPLSGVREGAINELGRLLRSTDMGLALAAQQALTELKNDDSHRVSIAAAETLAKYPETKGIPETEPEPKQLVAEAAKAEPAGAEPEAKPLEGKPEERKAEEQVIKAEAERKRDEQAVPYRIKSRVGVKPRAGIKPAELRSGWEHEEWVFWGKWVLATILGDVVASTLIYSTSFYSVLYNSLGFYGAQWISVPIYGVIVGIAQWFVLRQQISRAGWWILATFMGRVANFGLVNTGFGTLYALLSYSSASWITQPIYGAILGIAQWFVLRQQVSRAGWWILATTIGVLISNKILYSGGMELFRPIGGFFGSILGPPIVGGIDGMVIGAITGIALVWLLRNPTSEA